MTMSNVYTGDTTNTELLATYKPNMGVTLDSDAKKIVEGIDLASPLGTAPPMMNTEDAAAAATAALEQVSISSEDEHDKNVVDLAKEEIKGVRIEADTSAPPFPCIEKPESPNSAMSSSLSDRSDHRPIVPSSMSGQNKNTASDGPNLILLDVNGSDNDHDKEPDRHIGKIVSKGSRQSVASDSSSSTSEQTPASLHMSGTWGWFEDPHQQDSPGILGLAVKQPSQVRRNSANPTKAESERGDGKSTRTGKQGKKKKGGMLQFGGIVEPLKDIVEPPKESAAMAVTAPMYVLEENLSSQKLWKNTAGNRPPQPVEERAFYEKMWAQNFQRSQVTYEMPVEVLTASSPIALSPFADGSFGAGGDHCHTISNYNLAAPFNPNVSHRIRGGNGVSGDTDGVDAPTDAATVKAAEADAAEATLNFTNGAVGIYFDPNRPKGNNLKTLGPHQHHHTLVNKKVKGSECGDDLTVLVRGDNVFGTTVSKSFSREDLGSEESAIGGVVTVSVSIASYRVVESKKHGKYAQFLVIYCEGTFRETLGVWKRYSDFSALANKVTHGHEKCSSVLTHMNPLAISDETDFEMLPNAVTSWRLLKKRQRWYRCLDAGYLSLKVFLLERFLHDILFESSSPNILRDFVGTAQVQKLN